MSTARLAGRSYLVVTMADPSRSPYAECLPYLLSQAGATVELWHPGAGESAFRQIQGYSLKQEKSVRGGVITHFGMLIKAALSRGYTSVVVHSQVAGALAGLIPGFVWRSSLVYQTHDFYDPRAYRLHSRAEGYTLRRACLNMNGEYHRGQIYCLLHRLSDNPVVTHPALPRAAGTWRSDAILRERLAPNGEVVVTSNGPYSVLRRSDLLVRAVTRLGKRYRVVFTGPERRMPVAMRMEAGSQVTFMNPASFQGVLEISRNSDIGVLLYAHNDLGNYFQSPGRLTEYLASGLSVVYGPAVGLIARMSSIGEGQMAREYTEDGLAEAIEAAASLCDDRSRLRRRHLFQSTLCLEACGGEAVEAIAKVAGG